MTTNRGSAATRRALLHAAADLVRRDGVARLTLDAVAHAADVSKGGLLYHFPSKDALIAGLIAALLTRFESDLANARSDNDAGAWTRSYVHASQIEDPALNELSAALIAAMATNPSLLDPLRTQFARWQQQAQHDGIDPAVATIVRLAIDGLWFADLFGLAVPEAPLRARVVATLLALTREEHL